MFNIIIIIIVFIAVYSGIVLIIYKNDDILIATIRKANVFIHFIIFF